jgi:hypothetical protein
MDVELKNKKSFMKNIFNIEIAQGESRFVRAADEGVYNHSFCESDDSFTIDYVKGLNREDEFVGRINNLLVQLDTRYSFKEFQGRKVGLFI